MLLVPGLAALWARNITSNRQVGNKTHRILVLKVEAPPDLS